MNQFRQMRNPRNNFTNEERADLMPMSPKTVGESYMDLFNKSAMNTEALSEAFHGRRLKREEGLLALKDKYATGADQRNLDARREVGLRDNSRQGLSGFMRFASNYMNA